MDKEFAGLKELMTQRFDSVDQRLDALTAQVRETNGRVRIEETATADFRPRLRTLETEVIALRVPEHGDRRGIRVWDVSLVLTALALGWALLKALGRV